jgi:hypothetical protein
LKLVHSIHWNCKKLSLLTLTLYFISIFDMLKKWPFFDNSWKQHYVLKQNLTSHKFRTEVVVLIPTQNHIFRLHSHSLLLETHLLHSLSIAHRIPQSPLIYLLIMLFSVSAMLRGEKSNQLVYHVMCKGYN